MSILLKPGLRVLGQGDNFPIYILPKREAVLFPSGNTSIYRGWTIGKTLMNLYWYTIDPTIQRKEPKIFGIFNLSSRPSCPGIPGKTSILPLLNLRSFLQPLRIIASVLPLIPAHIFLRTSSTPPEWIFLSQRISTAMNPSDPPCGERSYGIHPLERGCTRRNNSTG